MTSRGRPLFLKIVYHGPAAMEALARYDRSLVVGILGGSAGTTFDAFHMLWEAKKYGARVALYGRKINNAEHQLSFIHYLRAVADDQLEPEEAVKAYHGALEKLGIRPQRSLADDLQRTETASSYSGTQLRRPQAAAPPLQQPRRRPDARFQQNEPGRKGAVESRTLEADRRLTSKVLLPGQDGKLFSRRACPPRCSAVQVTPFSRRA